MDSEIPEFDLKDHENKMVEKEVEIELSLHIADQFNLKKKEYAKRSLKDWTKIKNMKNKSSTLTILKEVKFRDFCDTLVINHDKDFTESLKCFFNCIGIKSKFYYQCKSNINRFGKIIS